MTPSLEPPPGRVRNAASPCPLHPQVDRRHGTGRDLPGLPGIPGNDPVRVRITLQPPTKRGADGAWLHRVPALT